jgi:glycosyltransferase involved in cell wall biosynthesis
MIRRVPIVYWLADLNPDQVTVLGKAGPRNPLVLLMKWLNRSIMSRASEVVVLDRYMAERIQGQYRIGGRLTVLPPWPHETALSGTKSESNPFSVEHNPEGRFVVMYSGNHSVASPVTTLLQAALQLQHDPRILFMFVGGGHGKQEVDEAIARLKPTNIKSLPYQPLDAIKYSLAAADIHVVTLGTEMPGIIHPCKVYGAMAVGRPVLYIGPRPSHVTDIIDHDSIGWHANHGDVAGTIAAIRAALEMPREARLSVGERAQSAVRTQFSKQRLCTAFCDAVERNLAAPIGRKSSLDELHAAPATHSTPAQDRRPVELTVTE